jgi:protein O-GlcNAc transferase
VHYRKSLRLKPDSAGFCKQLGYALQQPGRSEEAVAQYREVLRNNPEDAEAHNNLGVALIGLGRPNQALNHFREALWIHGLC